MLRFALAVLLSFCMFAPVALADKPAESKEASAVKKADKKEPKKVPLFNGKSFDGWKTYSGKPADEGWKFDDDGVLVCLGGKGSIHTKKLYKDFELTWEWKISKRGNSGLKYRCAYYKKGTFGRPGWLGCEYQMLDDKGRPSKNYHTTGALYALFAPPKEKDLKPVGEYNSSKVIVRGDKIEHWLNGKQTVSADTTSEAWKKRVAKSKFGPVKGFGVNREGHIQLQDHGNKAWFKNLMIREFEPAETSE